MTPKLLFANLCADVSRCIKAAQHNDDQQYADSLARGYKTAEAVHKTGNIGAYEESLLFLRGLEHARTSGRLSDFLAHTNILASQHAPF